MGGGAEGWAASSIQVSSPSIVLREGELGLQVVAIHESHRGEDGVDAHVIRIKVE